MTDAAIEAAARAIRDNWFWGSLGQPEWDQVARAVIAALVDGGHMVPAQPDHGLVWEAPHLGADALLAERDDARAALTEAKELMWPLLSWAQAPPTNEASAAARDSLVARARAFLAGQEQP